MGREREESNGEGEGGREREERGGREREERVGREREEEGGERWGGKGRREGEGERGERGREREERGRRERGRSPGRSQLPGASARRDVSLLGSATADTCPAVPVSPAWPPMPAQMQLFCV